MGSDMHRWIGAQQPNQAEAECGFSHRVRLSVQHFGALALIQTLIGLL
jgi:hypothetical protein